MPFCDHKFVDSKACLKCGWVPDRIVVVGGPRTGKSYFAKQMRELGHPTFCGDPRSTVKFPEPDVTYLPEGLKFDGDSGAAAWVAENWFPMRGPWLCEGHVMARALRRWRDQQIAIWDFWDQCPDPCDRIIVLKEHHPEATVSKKQRAMHKGVIETTWEEIAEDYEKLARVVEWSEGQKP
jgi:hypothetical protein